MRYLVVGAGGPGFASKEEAIEVLESVVLPSFTEFERLEKENKIIAEGLPVGDRSFVFISAIGKIAIRTAKENISAF